MNKILSMSVIAFSCTLSFSTFASSWDNTTFVASLENTSDESNSCPEGTVVYLEKTDSNDHSKGLTIAADTNKDDHTGDEVSKNSEVNVNQGTNAVDMYYSFSGSDGFESVDAWTKVKVSVSLGAASNVSNNGVLGTYQIKAHRSASDKSTHYSISPESDYAPISFDYNNATYLVQLIIDSSDEGKVTLDCMKA